MAEAAQKLEELNQKYSRTINTGFLIAVIMLAISTGFGIVADHDCLWYRGNPWPIVYFIACGLGELTGIFCTCFCLSKREDQDASLMFYSKCNSLWIVWCLFWGVIGSLIFMSLSETDCQQSWVGITLWINVLGKSIFVGYQCVNVQGSVIMETYTQNIYDQLSDGDYAKLNHMVEDKA